MKNISKAKRNTPGIYTGTAEALHFLSGGDTRVKTRGGVTDGLIDINPSGLQHIVEGYTPSAISSVIQLGEGTYKLFTGDLKKSDIVFFRDLQRDWQVEMSYKSEYYTLRNRLQAYEQRFKELTDEQQEMERNTNRYKAYEKANSVFDDSTEPKFGEDQQFSAQSVKALMEANELVNRDMFDTGFFEGFKFNTSD